AAAILRERHAVERARNELRVVLAELAVEEDLVAAHRLLVVAEAEVVLGLAVRQRRVLERHRAGAAAGEQREDQQQDAGARAPEGRRGSGAARRPGMRTNDHDGRGARTISRTAPSPSR